MKICFTGHRPDKLGGYDENNAIAQRIKTELKTKVESVYRSDYYRLNFPCQPLTFISGMALGVDTWAAEAVLNVRKYCKDIKFIAAIPFRTQSRIWPVHAKRRWEKILEQANQIYCVKDASEIALIEVHDMDEELTGAQAGYWLNKRNEWMVNNADVVMAIWNGTEGGTGNCVGFALQKQKKVYRFDPIVGQWGML